MSLNSEPTLSSTAAQVVAVPPATGVASIDAAHIAAADQKVQAILTAGGRPVMDFPACPTVNGTFTPYSLPGGLALRQGVHYRGVQPVTHQQNDTNGTWLADGQWNYIGGTVFKGDGSSRFLSANTTDQASVQSNIGATQIANVTVENLGIDGYTDGLAVGAQNIIGLVFSTVRNFYAKNCSGWGVRLVNYAHSNISRIYTCLCSGGGQLYASWLPGATFLPANSQHDELYHFKQAGAPGRLERGIVFETKGTQAGMQQCRVGRLQVNAFNTSLLSVTATLTSGSTNVAVPDGTQYRVGMLVNFTTAVGGFTANNLYVVQSISGNNLTLATSYQSTSAVSASGSGTATMQTYGYASVEIASRNTGATLDGNVFHAIDAEGATSCGIYVEGASNTSVSLVATPSSVGSPGMGVDLAGRNCLNVTFNAITATTCDFDGNCGTSFFYGRRANNYGLTLAGLWRDAQLGNSFALSLNGVFSGQSADLTQRAQAFLYPAGSGIGEPMRAFGDANTSLNGSALGNLVFMPTVVRTITLPTILDSTSNPQNSHLGLWFRIINVGTAALTVSTDGTQLVNKVAGKTTFSIAANSVARVVAVKDPAGALWWYATPESFVA